MPAYNTILYKIQLTRSFSQAAIHLKVSFIYKTSFIRRGISQIMKNALNIFALKFRKYEKAADFFFWALFTENGYASTFFCHFFHWKITFVTSSLFP